MAHAREPHVSYGRTKEVLILKLKTHSCLTLFLVGVLGQTLSGCHCALPDSSLYAVGAFDPEDLGEAPRQLYRVDPATGIAKVIADNLQGEPAGLAGSPDGRLLALDTDGFDQDARSQLLEIDRTTGEFSPIGASVSARSSSTVYPKRLFQPFP